MTNGSIRMAAIIALRDALAGHKRVNPADIVADGPHALERLTGRIVERPVVPLQPWHGALVATAHRDEQRSLPGDCWRSAVAALPWETSIPASRIASTPQVHAVGGLRARPRLRALSRDQRAR
jgi:hypothetical protein